MHNSKMRVGAEMLSCKLTRLTHLPRIPRQHTNKLSCFHRYQADMIACKYFCINFYNLASFAMKWQLTACCMVHEYTLASYYNK